VRHALRQRVPGQPYHHDQSNWSPSYACHEKQRAKMRVPFFQITQHPRIIPYRVKNLDMSAGLGSINIGGKKKQKNRFWSVPLVVGRKVQ
jgi:hypothetical protein